MAGKKTRKQARAVDIPGVLTLIIGLVVIIVVMVFAWPVVLLHGNARWVGEGIWGGLWAAAVVTGVMTYLRSTRDQRKLKRLRDERLWAEGNHPSQLRAQQERQLYEQKRQAEEQRRKVEEDRRQQLRDEIKLEERLREERLHGGR